MSDEEPGTAQTDLYAAAVRWIEGGGRQRDVAGFIEGLSRGTGVPIDRVAEVYGEALRYVLWQGVPAPEGVEF